MASGNSTLKVGIAIGGSAASSSFNFVYEMKQAIQGSSILFMR